MSFRYNPYRDTFDHVEDESPTTAVINVNTIPTAIVVQKVELTESCINEIAEAVAKKLREMDGAE